MKFTQLSVQCRMSHISFFLSEVSRCWNLVLFCLVLTVERWLELGSGKREKEQRWWNPPRHKNFFLCCFFFFAAVFNAPSSVKRKQSGKKEKTKKKHLFAEILQPANTSQASSRAIIDKHLRFLHGSVSCVSLQLKSKQKAKSQRV